MTDGRAVTLGDFGAGGPRSDVLIDRKTAAEAATTGDWAYQVHTSNIVAWHIPGTATTLLLRDTDSGWVLRRGSRLLGSRNTLAEGIEIAAAYMTERPEGQR